MNTETFVVPFEDTDSGEIMNPFKKQVMDFLCILEGFKVKFKNLHWSAANKAIHVQIDETLAIINKYEDEIAEEYQGIFTNFQPDFLKAFEVKYNSANLALKALMTNIETFYRGIPEELIYVGIKGNCESFMSDLNIQQYLYNLIYNSNLKTDM